ncbi:MAG: DEAD/DEAH box helicase [Myxococcales bacterium]|nr:DEAD/DEAH box helicase [Myxococcales bacterium]
MTDFAAMPRDFDGLLFAVPDGFSISERVVEPVALLSRVSGKISVRLGGKRTVRGEVRLIEAPSVSHAWIADGAVLRPLPKDAPGLVAKCLGDEFPDDISYATAIRLLRSPPEGLEVEAAPDILHSGKIAAEELPPEIDIPGLHADLFPYQARGVQWMRETVNRTGGLILADEMGLGKTLQALAAILEGRGEGDPPALIVCPTSVVHAWVDEAARFAPGLKTVARVGPRRHELRLGGVDLVVTSYALLRRDAELLASHRWSWAVLDEGQHVKNPASQTARAARRLQADHRLVLTGTPLENDLTELWSLFQFLMPGLLGRRSTFHARYAVASRRDGAPGAELALAELSHRIRPFVLRRRKSEVAKELPPRTERVVRVDLSERERALYEAIRATVRTELAEARRDGRHARNGIVLEGLLRLRQACCHPGLLPFPEAEGLTRGTKIDALTEMLQDAIPGGSRALVFSQWVGLLDRAAAALEVAGIAYARLDGSTEDRAGFVATFQDPDGPPVALISIKAGGTGLTLTAADLVFLLDPWWNPAVEAQATDRAHRIGQTRPVEVIRLVAADTVEDRVLALQAHKRRLFERTVDGPALDVSALTTDDLLGLLADYPSRDDADDSIGA